MIRAKIFLFLGAAALTLSACGNRQALKPIAGKTLPPAPRGAEKPKTAAELLDPGTQARPERNVELLSRSEERAEDEFDIPPK